jgi:uncharacterized RDD family membrane protein YckC
MADGVGTSYGWGGEDLDYVGRRFGHPRSGPNALAPWGRRFAAFVIDGLLFAGPAIALVVMAVSLSTTNDVGDSVPNPVPLLLLLPLSIAYVVYVISFTAMKGQTVGKMALSIRVARIEDGMAPGWGKAVGRWFVQAAISFFPFGSVLDGAWPLWDERRQALHDKAVSTVVVSVR